MHIKKAQRFCVFGYNICQMHTCLYSVSALNKSDPLITNVPTVEEKHIYISANFFANHFLSQKQMLHIESLESL